MGVMPEELLESQAAYINQLQASGSIIFANRKSTDQLQKASLDYAENLRVLSEYT
jgi:predicted oxidoreductase (fatty acid repression mutant protein)